MYNIYGFGRRIASYRKLAGLTQEELAARLNITAQAVSKWENEVCFPEITILPQLAQELNTTIEKLFGGKITNNGQSEGAPLWSFPEAKGKLKLVHTFQNVGCYSDKEVAVTTEDSVVFKDGSKADLRKQEITNKGSENICFDFADEHYFFVNGDSGAASTELNEVFSGITSLNLEITVADLQVVRSKDSYTRLEAVGTSVFIGSIQVKQNGTQLSIAQKLQNYQRNPADKIKLMLGQDLGSELTVRVSGSGSGDIQVPFKKASVWVSGSGDLNLTNVDYLSCRISGSGDVTVNKIGKAELVISGAGILKSPNNGDLGSLAVKMSKLNCNIDTLKRKFLARDINARGDRPDCKYNLQWGWGCSVGGDRRIDREHSRKSSIPEDKPCAQWWALFNQLLALNISGSIYIYKKGYKLTKRNK